MPSKDVAAENTDLKYWAFVSYSHADEAWARWVQQAVEKFPVPRSLVGRRSPIGDIPPRLSPVFRDPDQAAGSRELKPKLQTALRQSRAQIVICSREASRSRWLNEQIAYFKSLGREEQIFALIVDGVPHAAEDGRPELECLPEALRFQFNPTGTLTHIPAQPIVADARMSGDGKDNARLKLIAGLLGVHFDELKRPELRSRNRRLAFMSSLALSVTGVAIILAIQAYKARDEAEQRQRQAEELIQFMVADLGDKLESTGQLSALSSAGQKAADYFAILDPDSQSDGALLSRIRALRQIGDVRVRQGDMPGAVWAYEEALSGERALLKRQPDDPPRLRNVVSLQIALSEACDKAGDIDQAAAWIERTAESAADLLRREPGSPRWLALVVRTSRRLGTLAFERHDLERSRHHFQAARDAQNALVEQSGSTAEDAAALALLHSSLGAIETAQSRWQAAADEAAAEAAIWRELARAEPEDPSQRKRLAQALLRQMDSLAHLQNPSASDPVLVEALRVTRALAEATPDNSAFLELHAAALGVLEEAYLVDGQLDAAVQTNAQVLNLVRTLASQSPETTPRQEALMAAQARSARLALLRDEDARAAAVLTEALSASDGAAQRQAISPLRWFELQVLASAAKSKPRERQAHLLAAGEWLKQLQASGAVPPAELMMRQAAVAGLPDEARRWTSQLTARERAHPGVRQFCMKNPVCDAQVPVARQVPASATPPAAH